jgi:micrococcal nuclease
MITNFYRYEGCVSGDIMPNGVVPVRFALGFEVFAEKELMIDKKVDLKKGQTYVFDTKHPKDSNSHFWQATVVSEDWHRICKYKCQVEKVCDGDTITRAIVDLGFKTTVVAKFRLYGINTPELRNPTLEEGRVARDRLKQLVLDKEVIIETDQDKKDKYGRNLVTVYIDEINVNQLLLDEGLAVEYLL